MSQPDNPIVVTVDEHLESALESVDNAEARAIALAGEIGFSEEDAYQLGYAVREAMVNAVVHGNGYSANKTVHFLVARSQDTIRIVIEDQGAGFQPDVQDDPLAEENLLNQSGRGIMIIRAFVDEFAIEKRPEGGTRVVLQKTVPSGT